MERNFYTVRGYRLLEQNKDALTPSLEDYLEMICRTVSEQGYIRVSDLARELNVRPSSASKMVGRLSELGLVNYEKYGIIQLTLRGEEMGKYLLWRHDIVSGFFALISKNSEEASFVEAELCEHILSEDTVKSLETLILFFLRREDSLKEFQQMLEIQQDLTNK